MEVTNAIFVWGCMASHAMDYMCKIKVKMTQALYLSILQDEVMETIEWYSYNPSHVIFQHDKKNKKVFETEETNEILNKLQN